MIYKTSQSNESIFFNLIDNDLAELSIEVDGFYNCIIKDKNEIIYAGFILAISPTGKAKTICEVDFQKSSNDDKYHPRLIFKRTNENFIEKNVTSKSLTQRISFEKGQDGYREFWKMISFLKGFEDLVDTGNFNREYKVVSQNEVILFFNQKENSLDAYKTITDKLEINSTSILNYLTTVNLLKLYKTKIKEFIDQKLTEKDVQNWIDEDDHIYRNDRCMIFGLEFINHKREGGVNGNRYDIFTRIGTENEERVLIELKSPSDNIFDENNNPTINDNKIDYSLSTSLSRAIPQILEYRKDMEDKRAGDPELQKIGESCDIKISKCIIIIGSNKDNDTRWKKNLRELRRSLSSNLEIWTYTDLLYKIDSVIKNLENKRTICHTNPNNN